MYLRSICGCEMRQRRLRIHRDILTHLFSHPTTMHAVNFALDTVKMRHICATFRVTLM